MITISWSTILAVCSGLVAISGAVTVLVKFSKWSRGKYVASVQEIVDDGFKEKIEGAVSAGVSSGMKEVTNKLVDIQSQIDEMQTDFDEKINSLQKQIDTIQSESKASFKIIKKTLMDDVRQTLKEIHDNCMREGYVSEHLYFVFQQLCQDYLMPEPKGLGGNSFVEDYWGDMQDLNDTSRLLDLQKK